MFRSQTLEVNFFLIVFNEPIVQQRFGDYVELLVREVGRNNEAANRCQTYNSCKIKMCGAKHSTREVEVISGFVEKVEGSLKHRFVVSMGTRLNTIK